MFFYLLFILFAYYILKPVSRAMFLTKFDVDRLPSLYILMAVFGGIFAYLYSKLAAKSSLRAAVLATMSLSVVSLVVMWMLIRLPWMVYVFNIWVSLFSIVLVAQGWLVASNLFDPREAKRLYPLLGMGMVLGAAFGGEFTNRTALLVGTRNLMLASAVMVILAYLFFRLATRRSSASLSGARAAASEESDFSFSTIFQDLGRVRHLQVIVAIMVVMYVVDTMVEYQFQVTARASHTGANLAAFFGQFYGLYLNLAEFVFQLFLTASVVRRFGVGGTLQIAPASILLSSIATVFSPGVTAAGAVRLTEASTRYTLNRTGMELLYMPLPQELRNRMKAFIDICVDRLSRGIGGVLLILLTITPLHLGVKGIALIVMALCVPWIYFSHLARREYVATIRKRFEARQLDFANLRIAVAGPVHHPAARIHARARQRAPGSLCALAAGGSAALRAAPRPVARRRQFPSRAARQSFRDRRGPPHCRPGMEPPAARARGSLLRHRHLVRPRARLPLLSWTIPTPPSPPPRSILSVPIPHLAGQLLTPAWLERVAASPDPAAAPWPLPPSRSSAPTAPASLPA